MANIQQRSPNSWFFTVYTGKQANGKYGRATKTITIEDEKLLKTTKKLNDYLEDEYGKFRQEVQAGEYIAPEKMTFEAFVEEWKEKYAVKHLQPATLETYLIHLKNRIIPEFGHQRIDAIKTMQVVSFIDGLSKVERQDGKEGTLSAGTIQYIYRALKNVFNRAVDWKVIKTYPVQNVKKPKVERTEMNVYSKSEVEDLFLALEKELPHWRMIVSLALTTGLRRGELVGLEWKHIDFDNKTLQVQQSISSTKENSLIIGEPKTKASIRKVSLPESQSLLSLKNIKSIAIRNAYSLVIYGKMVNDISYSHPAKASLSDRIVSANIGRDFSNAHIYGLSTSTAYAIHPLPSCLIKAYTQRLYQLDLDIRILRSH